MKAFWENSGDVGGTAENGFPEARVPEQRDQELSEATVEKKMLTSGT